MAGKPQGYHNRQEPICSKIRSLLISLTKDPSKYDEITPKVEYWIEYVLRHRFATVDELVEGVSGVAWDDGGPFSSIGRFLKEFNDAPHRSEQARSFVTQLPPYVLQWFAIASVEDLWTNSSSSLISKNGGPGFIRAASFIGSLIGWDLLNHELVRQHLTKPLTNHYDNHDHPCSAEATRANAIYQLFTAAGDNLLQGLIEAEDVQVCFNILNLRRGWITRLDLAKLQRFRDVHAVWLLRRVEEKKETDGPPEEGKKSTVTAETSVGVKTPAASVPQNLPGATTCTEHSSSVLQNIECSPVFHDGDSSLESSVNIPSGTVSPTLSFPGVGSTGSAPSLFSGPKPEEQPGQPQPKPTVTLTSIANVPSLVARMGPQVTNTLVPAQNTTKPNFGFNPAPAPSATKPSFAFNPPTPATTTTNSVSEPPKPVDDAPKFSFGFNPPIPATSSTSTTAPIQAATTSIPFGKSGQLQPSPPTFGATGQTRQNASPFGTTGQSQPISSFFGTTGQSEPIPSPFGATNQSQPSPSPFGATGQPNPAFWDTSQPSPTVFGTQPASSQPSKSPFNFGWNKPVGGTDLKVAFPPSTLNTAVATGTSPGAFLFATDKQDTSKPDPSPQRNGFLFGTTSAPVNAFSTTTATTPSIPAPATGKPMFSFNSPNTFGTTTTNETTGSKSSQFVFTSVTPSTSTGDGATSPFNFGTTRQRQNGTTPAAFGFGPPDQRAFSFGKLEEKK